MNCALWSNEVYEEESGQLAGLSAALRRGGRTRCEDCGQLGATMTCLNGGRRDKGNHDVVIHFACALRRSSHTGAKPSIFTSDRSWFCCVECRSAVRRHRLHDAIRDLQMERKKQRQRFHLGSDEDYDDDDEENDYQSNEDNLVSADVSETEVRRLARQIDADLEVILLFHHPYTYLRGYTQYKFILSSTSFNATPVHLLVGLLFSGKPGLNSQDYSQDTSKGIVMHVLDEINPTLIIVLEVIRVKLFSSKSQQIKLGWSEAS